MATMGFFIFFLFSLFISVSTSIPKQLVLPVNLVRPSNLYIVRVSTGNPKTPSHFILDINGWFLQLNCEHKPHSSSYFPLPCKSPRCSLNDTHTATYTLCSKCYTDARPGCHNDTCGVRASNPLSRQEQIGELAEDLVIFPSSQGLEGFPIPCLLACVPSTSYPSLNGVEGTMGFGAKSPVAIPSQVSSLFHFKTKQFVLCLKRKNGTGAIFLGDGPFSIPRDFTRKFTYTSLKISHQGVYYINLTSIKVNNEVVHIQPSLLSVNREGFGGAKLSTVVPFMTLQSSIFNSVVESFSNQLIYASRVASVPPFQLCYNSSGILYDNQGPVIPEISFVLDNKLVWRFMKANLATEPNTEAFCLAVVDGGQNTRASVVIGNHQLLDFIVHVDISRSILGFVQTPQLVSCTDFKATSH